MVSVSKKTHIYKVDTKTDKYIIGFAPELVSIIKSGEKVLTYRYGMEKDYLVVGDKVRVMDSVNNLYIGQARVVSKSKSLFIDLPFDIPGHETYKDKEHQRKVFSGYYAFLGREIRDEDEFLVLSFELIRK